MLGERGVRGDVDQVAERVHDAELGHGAAAEQHGDGREDAQRVACSAARTDHAADQEAQDPLLEAQRRTHAVLLAFFIQQRILHYFKFMIRWPASLSSPSLLFAAGDARVRADTRQSRNCSARSGSSRSVFEEVAWFSLAARRRSVSLELGSCVLEVP